MKEQRKRTHTVKDQALAFLFGQKIEQELGKEKTEEFRWNHLIGRAVSAFGNKEYEDQLTKSRIFEEDQGIEIPVFSQNIKLALFKNFHYTLSVYEEMDRKEIEKIKRMEESEQWKIQAHEEYKEAKEKDLPQAVIYYLDNFSNSDEVLQNNIISHVFIDHMVRGMKENDSSMEKGDTSLEFISHLIKGFRIIRDYANSLSSEERNKLNKEIQTVLNLQDNELNSFAKNYIIYAIRTIKSAGSLDDWTFWRKDQIPKPKDAVEMDVEHLGCSYRNLPEIVNSLLPWKEYTTNRWDLNHEIFGRYELREGEKIVRVDYKLDSKYFPGKYHFFNKLEIAQSLGHKKQHIIFGQGVNQDRMDMAEAEGWKNPETVFGELFHQADFIYPVIIAGYFDFNDEETKSQLTLLAENKNTKSDVAVVLRDILEMAKIGVLMKAKN